MLEPHVGPSMSDLLLLSPSALLDAGTWEVLPKMNE